MKEGSFKIDHPLFEDIVFSSVEAAECLAVKLCVFLIKNTDTHSTNIDVLRYDTAKDSEGTVQTIWWWHKTVNAELKTGEIE